LDITRALLMFVTGLAPAFRDTRQAGQAPAAWPGGVLPSMIAPNNAGSVDHGGADVRPDFNWNKEPSQ
jgi:hypothetical protein